MILTMVMMLGLLPCFFVYLFLFFGKKQKNLPFPSEATLTLSLTHPHALTREEHPGRAREHAQLFRGWLRVPEEPSSFALFESRVRTVFAVLCCYCMLSGVCRSSVFFPLERPQQRWFFLNFFVRLLHHQSRKKHWKILSSLIS